MKLNAILAGLAIGSGGMAVFFAVWVYEVADRLYTARLVTRNIMMINHVPADEIAIAMNAFEGKTEEREGK